MKCRSCSAEIDAKAIVCYRCGAPTASPPPSPGPSRRAMRGRAWLLLLAVLAAAAGAAYLVWHF